MKEIEAELKGYGESVWSKPRMLVLTKIDAVDADELAAANEAVKSFGLPVFQISAVSGEGIDALLHEVNARVQAMRAARKVETEEVDDSFEE